MLYYLTASFTVCQVLFSYSGFFSHKSFLLVLLLSALLSDSVRILSSKSESVNHFFFFFPFLIKKCFGTGFPFLNRPSAD